MLPVPFTGVPMDRTRSECGFRHLRGAGERSTTSRAAPVAPSVSFREGGNPSDSAPEWTPAPAHAGRRTTPPAGCHRSRAISSAAIPRFRTLNPTAAMIEAV